MPSYMITNISAFIWQRYGLLGMKFARGLWHGKIVLIQKFVKKLCYATTTIKLGVRLLCFEVCYGDLYKKKDYATRFVEG